MVTQEFAMIGEEDDDGVLVHAPLAKRCEDVAQLFVDVVQYLV